MPRKGIQRIPKSLGRRQLTKLDSFAHLSLLELVCPQQHLILKRQIKQQQTITNFDTTLIQDTRLYSTEETWRNPTVRTSLYSKPRYKTPPPSRCRTETSCPTRGSSSVQRHCKAEIESWSFWISFASVSSSCRTYSMNVLHDGTVHDSWQ